MKKTLWIGLIVASLIVGACGAPPEDDAPGDSPAEEMVFEEEDLDDIEDNEDNGSGDEGEEMIFDEDEAAEDETADDEGEMVFEDDEGMQIYLESIPPTGQWSLTHLAGITVCPTITLEFDADPPVIVTLGLSEDALIMTLSTPEGEVILHQWLVGTEGEIRASFYQGSVIVGEEELIYDVDYNFLGDGMLGGFISNDSQGCHTERAITAEYIGP